MRITRKMRRERKNAVNPLEELLIIMKQYFPKLTSWIENLTDTRHQSYITYDFKICLLTQILAFCSSYQSMNKIGRDFNSDIVIKNINNILKTNYVELPHKDTLINVISEIKLTKIAMTFWKEKKNTLQHSIFLTKFTFYLTVQSIGLFPFSINILLHLLKGLLPKKPR